MTEIELLREQNERLRKAVMNQCGDNLCWIEEELPAARALPESEFLESCRRYRHQIARENGELQIGQMTIAQLEAECERLRAEPVIMKTIKIAGSWK